MGNLLRKYLVIRLDHEVAHRLARGREEFQRNDLWSHQSPLYSFPETLFPNAISTM